MVEVAESNKDMYAAWDGDEGARWTRNMDGYERSTLSYRRRFLEAIDPKPGMDVLDFGCGGGLTTLEVARRVAPGRVLALDLSAQMLGLARNRAAEAGLGNVEFVQADAQVHPFTERHDLAISQFGSMFFGDPPAAFANIRSALVPDGRLMLLVWRALEFNEWTREMRAALTAGGEVPTPPPNAPGPAALADPDRVHSVLTAAGFRDIELTEVAEEMVAGTDVEDAFAFAVDTGFAQSVLATFDDAGRDRAVGALRATMQDHATDEGVRFGSATWLVSARA